jgi:lantibiotic modifying enzyme
MSFYSEDSRWFGVAINDTAYKDLLTRVLNSLIKNENSKNYSFADGYSGLATIFGYANEIFPDSGYDLLAHKYLKASIEQIESTKAPKPLGAFSGLTGIAFAALYLSGDSGSYKSLLTSLDNIILKNTEELAIKLKSSKEGLARYYFDVISGATGIGAYLLMRGQKESLAALDKILDAMIYLIGKNEDLLYFYTPNIHLFDWEKQIFKSGVLDCGMAHGVAGPLSLMSLAYMHDVKREGMKESIEQICDLLVKRAKISKDETDMPGIVEIERHDDKMGIELEEKIKLSNQFIPTRVAWCYGNPGISRALYLGGRAIKREKYIENAISGMKTAYKKMRDKEIVDSPTFCHGIAGILEITLRFMNDTNQSLFREQGILLLNQLYEMNQEDSLLGYKNISFDRKLEDNCGMLEGTSGIIMTLLAATSNIEPACDRIFLIS